MGRSFAVATALCGVIWGGVARGEEVPQALAGIRQELAVRVSSGELPSVAFGVLQDGAVLWREAFGWADRERGVEATPETVYGLASLGKSITATAVLALVERGELSLDAPIAPLLAPARLRRGGGGPEPDVTLCQALRMTAAVPHGNYTYDRAEDAAAVTSERMVRDRGVVIFPPIPWAPLPYLAPSALALAGKREKERAHDPTTLPSGPGHRHASHHFELHRFGRRWLARPEDGANHFHGA